MINQPTFTKHYDTFDNISKIYSDKLPQGKDLDLLHIALYFRFLSYQGNNLNCYESHETLAKIFKSSSSTIKRKIKDLKEMGLLETSPHPDPNITSLVYTALLLTDAHITPPEEVKDSVNAEQAAPEYQEPLEPTITNVIEEAVIVPQSAPESVAATTESDQAVIDKNKALEVVCERLSHPDSLRQSQRYDTFTAYARRVLGSDGKRLSCSIEERLEKRFEQLYPHLYSRFELPF
ncbi:transcriptional regulator [Escherichia coli]|uniref:transcriptional regulator n=1 Tax=Escherichia coli TaxID=562 RepID=UPI000BE1ED71|nr:transcriptional regulator [Escherichia coli]EJM2326957.1 transcriptional regulator [Escherichia coli]HBN6464424.1 transcriptional regulator [Escherichia coli]